ncbi:MAG: flippase-like domain-containing protein [Candidatus Delongbacteria bacterium]|nr:flippase-like domain-containing protein [Candidatus Delongbacteria bacterium]
MKKIVIYIILGVLLTIFIVRSNFNFSILTNISIVDFIYLSLSLFLSYIITIYAVKLNFDLYRVKEKFTTISYITLASSLLNYLPGKAGLISIGTYLKVKHKVPINKYIFVNILDYVLVTLMTVIGAVLLLNDKNIRELVFSLDLKTMLFTLALAVALIILAYFLAKRTKEIKISAYYITFVKNINIVFQNKFIVLKLSFAIIIGILFFSLRMYLSFLFTGNEISIYESILIGIIANLSFFFSFTPGGLGVKEGMVGGISFLLFGNAEIGIIASLLDRVVNVIWIVILGTYSIKKSERIFKNEVSK